VGLAVVGLAVAGLAIAGLAIVTLAVFALPGLPPAEFLLAMECLPAVECLAAPTDACLPVAQIPLLEPAMCSDFPPAP
jgi:hypothetical protein